MIDISFNMHSDANGGDPDVSSPTLRAYHKFLWSKPLPSGDLFDLRDDEPGYYLNLARLRSFQDIHELNYHIHFHSAVFQSWHRAR
ncbi:MAG: hypothetical protein WBI25_12835, partial [Smithellaceae bacterium]